MPVIGTPVLTLTPPPVGGVPDPICDPPAVAVSGTGADCQPVENLPVVPGSCEQQDCSWIFGTLRVTPTIGFGSRVEWSLHPGFSDPGPYTFQLQAGRTGLTNADDWEAIGLPAVDAFYMLDDTQRVFGKTNWTHYRVCLETPLATYFSPPIAADGDMSPQDRREWRTVITTWLKLFKLRTGQDGYLLKRKLFGQPCPESCVDFQTKEITDPECPTCYGTGFVGGYFEPAPCVYASLDPRVSHNERDAGQARGTINDALRVKATMLGVPQVFENDVWVDKQTDRRWYIHQIQHRIEIRGVAAVIDCEFRLAPFTDPIYQIEITDQIPA
jgi:hypothetical protein